jgi:hypothetical protein
VRKNCSESKGCNRETGQGCKKTDWKNNIARR